MLEFKRSKNFIFNIPVKLNFKVLLKLFLLPIWDVIYFLFFKCFCRKKPNLKKKFDVSICAIFKDEALYFVEWIEYHKLIGINHFYLYNNFSNDNFQEVLDPYISDGIVTLVDWPIKFGQGSAYQDCFQKYQNDTSWIAFLDIDEFICLKWDLKILPWLRKFKNYPSIALYWKMFGTCGKIKRTPNSLIIEDFYNCWPKFSDVTKVIINTNYSGFDFNDMHTMSVKMIFLNFKFRIYPINEFYRVLRYGINFRTGFKSSESFTVQINHYWSKSYNDYVTKKSIRGVPHLNQPRDLEIFYIHENNNTSSDFTIWRHLIRLKTVINNLV